MLNEYLIENLVVGELVTIHNIGGNTPLIPTIAGPYIFNKIPSENGKKQKYQEIFTEDVYKESISPENQKFGKTYAMINGKLSDYLTKEEINRQQINKTRILEIYTNMVKEQPKVKTNKKTKK